MPRLTEARSFILARRQGQTRQVFRRRTGRALTVSVLIAIILTFLTGWPVRLAWSRTGGSHPSDTGSNPVRATIFRESRFARRRRSALSFCSELLAVNPPVLGSSRREPFWAGFFLQGTPREGIGHLASGHLARVPGSVRSFGNDRKSRSIRTRLELNSRSLTPGSDRPLKGNRRLSES